jgi:Arylsulfatase A and related enzymes
MAEHGEWSKFSNFEIAVRVPLIVYVPGLTNTGSGRSTDALVELVDVFPTLTELAGLPSMPLCPVNSSGVSFCTEGVSALPILLNLSRQVCIQTFS